METRVDEYLQDTTQTGLSIKRRGKTVEIKGLIAKPNKTLSFASCQSKIELWGKWSSATLDLSGAPLFPLQKERSQRRFRNENGQIVEVAGGDQRRASGCNFEITILMGADRSHGWTLGFEAFGQLNEIENILATTTTTVSQRRPPDLPPGQAASYASWLVDRDC
jgi:hypothetical protein